MTPAPALHAFAPFAPPCPPRALAAPRPTAGIDTPPRGGLSRRALMRACEFMHAHIGDRFTLQDVASAAAVSRFHFARMFRVSTGMSPMAYLQRLRIDLAQAWLRDGDRRIADVAAALGFCDQSHFTRTFRRSIGLAPRDFARTAAAAPMRAASHAQAMLWRLPAAANDDARSSAA